MATQVETEPGEPPSASRPRKEVALLSQPPPSFNSQKKAVSFKTGDDENKKEEEEIPGMAFTEEKEPDNDNKKPPITASFSEGDFNDIDVMSEISKGDGLNELRTGLDENFGKPIRVLDRVRGPDGSDIAAGDNDRDLSDFGSLGNGTEPEMSEDLEIEEEIKEEKEALKPEGIEIVIAKTDVDKELEPPALK